jgi:hypothetical protein
MLRAMGAPGFMRREAVRTPAIEKELRLPKIGAWKTCALCGRPTLLLRRATPARRSGRCPVTQGYLTLVKPS